jgi:hypothetical protein
VGSSCLEKVFREKRIEVLNGCSRNLETKKISFGYLWILLKKKLLFPFGHSYVAILTVLSLRISFSVFPLWGLDVVI